MTNFLPLPAPLTKPDADLRAYEWMPLDINRLLTSTTWILSTDAEKVAAITLWCESWRQVPAASIPNDDRLLAHLSRTGRMWKKYRPAVMKSWILCSDNRFYHPVVAEKANEALSLKKAKADRTEAARQAKLKKNKWETLSDNACHSSVTEFETDDVTVSNGEEKNRTDKKDSVPSELTAAAVATPPPVTCLAIPASPAPDVRTELWNEGLATLKGITGRSEASLRSYLGKALKALHDDAAVMLSIIRECASLSRADPLAWMSEAVKKRAEPPKDTWTENILKAAGLDQPGNDGVIIDHLPDDITTENMRLS